MKKTAKNLFTGAAIGAVCGLYFGYEKNKEEKLIKWRMEHPGIAIKGEKVRALEDYHPEFEDTIWRGKIYTVLSYYEQDNEYSFLECPPQYNPYVGGTCVQSFPVELFEIISPENEDNVDL